jgi:DNA-binding GntR family transcriptional regulator
MGQTGNGAGDPPGGDGVRCRAPWQARRELRRAILERRLLPGQVLHVRDLATFLQTSVAIAQEVLTDLTREGLVEDADGASVVMVTTAEEAEELDDLRVVLQQLVVRGFVGHASSSQVRALRRAVHRFADLVGSAASPADLFAAKEWVYGLLLRGCGNKSVIPLLARIRGRVSVVTAAALAQPGIAECMAVELRAILRAVEMRDAETAARLCRIHLCRTREAGLVGLAIES